MPPVDLLPPMPSALAEKIAVDGDVAALAFDSDIAGEGITRDTEVKPLPFAAVVLAVGGREK